MIKPSRFEEELRNVINRYSMENGSNTPDFILAQYLDNCLSVFNSAVQRREKWYGRGATPGMPDFLMTLAQQEDEVCDNPCSPTGVCCEKK